MLVLLPPSETKSNGGTAGPVDLDGLSFSQLNPQRHKLIEALIALADDPAASVTALGLGPTQGAEATRNAELRTAPTMPALLRYTGVLYDALNAATLTPRARARLAIGSALFGVLRAHDPVPAYRLSAASTVPGLTSLRTFWRPVLTPVLTAVDELVVDLRSGAYAALGPVRGSVRVTVLTESTSGARTVVSHTNKAHKGLLARALANSRAEPHDVAGVARIASKAGLRVELGGDTNLVVLT